MRKLMVLISALFWLVSPTDAQTDTMQVLDNFKRSFNMQDSVYMSLTLVANEGAEDEDRINVKWTVFGERAHYVSDVMEMIRSQKNCLIIYPLDNVMMLTLPEQAMQLPALTFSDSTPVSFMKQEGALYWYQEQPGDSSGITVQFSIDKNTFLIKSIRYWIEDENGKILAKNSLIIREIRKLESRPDIPALEEYFENLSPKKATLKKTYQNHYTLIDERP